MSNRMIIACFALLAISVICLNISICTFHRGEMLERFGGKVKP